MHFVRAIILGLVLFSVGSAQTQVQLNPGESRTFKLHGGEHLTLDARIQFDQPAGAAYLLRVTANGRPLEGLLNKKAAFTYVDGRTFPYCNSDHNWNVFYSPNFQDNNSKTNSYAVTTDPGQAYRYEWKIPGAQKELVEITVRHGQYHQGQVVNRPIVVNFVTKVAFVSPRSPWSIKRSMHMSDMGEILGSKESTSLPPSQPAPQPPPRRAPSTVPNGGLKVTGPIRMSCGPDQPGFSFEPTGNWKTSLYVSHNYLREEDGCCIETSYEQGGLGLDPETQFDQILAFLSPGQPATEIRLDGSRALIKRGMMGSSDALVLAFPKKDLFIRIRIWSLKSDSREALDSLIHHVVQTFRWIPPKQLSSSGMCQAFVTKTCPT